MASLEEAETKVSQSNKARDVAIQNLGELRENKEGAKYERDGLEAKLQRAQRGREKCAEAVNSMQGGAGKLRKLLKKD